MQPYIFPYIGYFQLIKSANTFVFYDDVNFIKKGWINRNKILINGEESLVSFPCIKISQNKEIKEVEIDLTDQQYKKILRKISLSYKTTPFYKEVFPIVEKCFLSGRKTISHLAIESVESVCEYLEIKTIFKVSSEEYPQTKDLPRADRLIEISKIEGATSYINSMGGKELYTKEYFESKGIDLQFLNPVIKEYKQFGEAFVPSLSIIDVLMFNSKDEILNMLDNYDIV